MENQKIIELQLVSKEIAGKERALDWKKTKVCLDYSKVEECLLSEPVTRGIKYYISIIRGSSIGDSAFGLFRNSDFGIGQLMQRSCENYLNTAPVELAGLLYDHFSFPDSRKLIEIGLKGIMVMHKPVGEEGIYLSFALFGDRVMVKPITLWPETKLFKNYGYVFMASVNYGS